MSALSQQLFHGTHVELNPGDIIKPRKMLSSDSVNYGVNPVHGEDVGEHAYATNDVEEAKWFAGESARQHNGKPHVYEVAPLGRTKSRRLYDKSNTSLPAEAHKVREHLSKQGFTVIKKVEQ